MPLRLNWTERKRINRTDAGVAVDRTTSPPRFTATLRLGSYGLPPDARVVIEAYRQTTWRRFDFGTVALSRPQAECTLEAFGDADAVLFRLKVLSADSDSGRILAEADRLRVTDPTEEQAPRRSLLPTRGDDLGEEIFQLLFDGPGDAPTLVLNSRLGDWRQTARSAHFRSLVYPELLRQILLRAAEGYDDESGWQSDWVSFASRIPGTMGPPDDLDARAEETRTWIGEVVSAFCRNQQFLSRYANVLTDGGGT